MSHQLPPHFREPLQKNDALFMYGACMPHPYVLAYEVDAPSVVYGPSCNISKEIRTDACRKDRIPIFRRRTGGGTVILSAGMVVTVVVGTREGTRSAPWYFDTIHDGMLHLLAESDITSVRKDGISDLSCNGRKILGSSLYLGTSPRLFYYQSSIMVNSELSLLSQYLHHPPREPEYRNARPHESFCTTLVNEGFPVTGERIAALFNNRLGSLISKKLHT